MYIIGTAGHVDHGKSTLVQALTGIDPDRLQEEKARGMTIDLGFAWLRLPGGQEVSIVDVPGHERFIKNMLAGVGGIDLALLVIAADEGVMPQTREHLAIIDLLRIRSGVVAITKSDLVERDWLDLVVADVEEVLASTTLAGATIVPCSAYTREGLDRLLVAIEQRLADTTPKRDIGRPRLAIDRAFTISGFGTVVTGTLIDGALQTGQEVEIVPGGARSRIRGLQSHRHKTEIARPGTRVAVNLTGLAVEDLHRGQVLTTPNWLRPAAAVDVALTAVTDLAHPLKHNATVTFHSGAAEVEARVRLLDRDELRGEEPAWAQLRLAEPLALVKGDGFVIRSPNETLGGGVIVETRARRHRRFDAGTMQTLETLARGAPEESVFTLLTRMEPVDLATLVKQTEFGEDETRAAVEVLIDCGRAVALGEPDVPLQRTTLLITGPGLAARWERAQAALGTYFTANPLRSGIPREELKSRVGLQGRAWSEVLAVWLRAGQLIELGATVAPPNRLVTLTPEQEKEAARFEAQLRVNPFAPAPDRLLPPDLLAYLAEQGRVIPVGEGIVFDAGAFAEMQQRIVAHLRAHETVTLAEVRDLFGASRKYAQALLEYLDQRGVTRRVGDARVLRG